MTPIAPLIEAFLRETLASQRGTSRHMQDSYAASFQLLFTFAGERLKVRPSALTLEQLDAGLVSAFLEHLEDVRGNAAVTRNVRLAAIKSFFRFLEYRQPAALLYFSDAPTTAINTLSLHDALPTSCWS